MSATLHLLHACEQWGFHTICLSFRAPTALAVPRIPGQGVFPDSMLGCWAFSLHCSHPPLLGHMIQEAGESMMTIPYGFYAGFNHVINCTQAINFPILRHMTGKVNSVKLPGQGQLLHSCLHVHPATKHMSYANRVDSCGLSGAHDTFQADANYMARPSYIQEGSNGPRAFPVLPGHKPFLPMATDNEIYYNTQLFSGLQPLSAKNANTQPRTSTHTSQDPNTASLSTLDPSSLHHYLSTSRLVLNTVPLN